VLVGGRQTLVFGGEGRRGGARGYLGELVLPGQSSSSAMGHMIVWVVMAGEGVIHTGRIHGHRSVGLDPPRSQP
jgi:hypothetical protein